MNVTLDHIIGALEFLETRGLHVMRAMRILCTLDRVDGSGADGLLIKQISARLSYSSASLSYHLGHLESIGLLTRTIARGDRRGVLVTITEAGKNLVRQAIAATTTATT